MTQDDKDFEASEGSPVDLKCPEDSKDQSKSSEEEKSSAEADMKDFLLGGRPPLKTIWDLSWGPMISQLISAFYGVITTLFISKAVGPNGLSAQSNYAVFDAIGRSFGYFLSAAASIEISSLFGAKKTEEVHQLGADIFRFTIVLGIIVPAILIPTVKIAARWFGASEPIVELGFEYICPLSACAIFSILYIAITGIMMAEGRTGYASIAMICALVLNMGLFCPLFLFAFHLGMKGAAWATVASEALTGIVLTVLYFFGYFQVKPTLKMLISKPSPYLLTAFKLGLSTLLAQLSAIIPAIIVRKVIGMTCVYDSYDEVMSSYICSFRIQTVVMAIIFALYHGLIPSLSYAYQSHKYKRFLWLVFHTSWMMFGWGTFCCIVTWTIPRQLGSLFSNGEKFLNYSGDMISIVNGLSMVTFGKFVGQGVLQSMQYAWTSMIASLINNLGFVIFFAFVMYWTNDHDPMRITWCYSLSYAASLIFTGCICAKPLLNLFFLGKQEDNLENEDKKRVISPL